MSIILALETATVACSAALWVKGQINSRFEIAPQHHSDLILNLIDELLHEANINLSNVNAVAFGCGPGSFMGVRIATGIAQGIAYGIGCPVIPVSTLQTIAQSAYEKYKQKQMIVAWDARMNAVYWGGYEVDDQGVMQMIIPDQLSDPDTFELGENQWVGVGNAWSLYPALLKTPNLLHAGEIKQEKSHAQSHEIKRVYADIYPEARAMLLIANQKFIQGDPNYIVPPEKGEPVYIREAVARHRSEK